MSDLTAADLSRIEAVNESGDYESTTRLILDNTMMAAALRGFAKRADDLLKRQREDYTMAQTIDLLRDLAVLDTKGD